MPKIALPRSFITPDIKDDKQHNMIEEKKKESAVYLPKQDYILSMSGINHDQEPEYVSKQTPYFAIPDKEKTTFFDKPIDTSKADKLEDEKKMLQNQLKRLLDKRKELEQRPKQNTSDNKNFPLDRLHEYESQIKSMVDVESTKRTSIAAKKQQLKDKLAEKHKGLTNLETDKEKIINRKEQNHLLLIELDNKKSELVNTTLGLNAHIEFTLNTAEDFRLLRYFKEQSGNAASKSREYCPEQVVLSAETLPKGLINENHDTGFLRFKFLISKKKGLIYEDENIKIALKVEMKSENSPLFVLRFMNQKQKTEWVSTMFLNNYQKFKFSVDKRVFEIEPKEYYDLEFEIATPPLDEMPVLQLKSKRGETDSLLVTNLSLPITANWYFPLLRVTASQFSHYWANAHGYLLQTEMREIDHSIFAGEVELLALIDKLVVLPDEEQNYNQARRFGSTMHLPSGLAGMQISVSQASYFYIEMICDKRDAAVGKQILLSYLFALSKFIVD